MKKINKPKRRLLWDGEAECITEHGSSNEAFGVKIDAFIYDSKNIRKLKRWLISAERWIENKEKYKGRGF